MNERMELSLGLENVENKEVDEWEFVQQHVAIDIDPVQPSVVGETCIRVKHSSGVQEIGDICRLKLDITNIQIQRVKCSDRDVPLHFEVRSTETCSLKEIQKNTNILDLASFVTRKYVDAISISQGCGQLIIEIPSKLLRNEPSEAIECGIVISYKAAGSANISMHGLNFWRKKYVVSDSNSPSAWFPCSGERILSFHIEITVPANHTAVCSGILLSQTWNDPSRKKKRFRYKMPYHCSAHDICFASGPFQTISDTGIASLSVTYFIPDRDDVLSMGDISPTIHFLPLLLNFMESSDVCNINFPFPSFHQVFLPPEVAWRPLDTGAGIQIMSYDLILLPKSIEQSQETRLRIVEGVSRQWFGHYARPASSSDIWLLVGLAGWLEEQYVRKFMGKTEAAYSRWRRRHALVLADYSGMLPPLSCRDFKRIGQESFEYKGQFSLKATSVVSMIERKGGEELFKRQVEALLLSRTENSGPVVCSNSFIENLSKATDFKNEWRALLERWVHGRGVPTLTLGFRFHRRGSYLEVGIHQKGSRGALAAALSADKVASSSQISTGVVKVVVKEGSGSTAEHPVHVGSEAFVSAELRVNPEVKKVQRKRGRKRKDEQERLAELVAAVENMQHPVQWVRLDPFGEWPCGVKVLQPERTLSNQLRDSRDVVAQCEAVRGLAELVVSEVSQGPLLTLKEALEENRFACRVRCEAACALGLLRDENGNAAGLKSLLSFYMEKYWDGKDAVKPVLFPSIDDYIIAQEVVMAVAVCAHVAEQDDAFEAFQFLLDCVQSYQSSWKDFDDSGLLASLLRGLGKFRLPKIKENPELKEIDAVEYVAGQAHEVLMRYLKRELVAPSPWCVVGQAAIAALCDLMTGPSGLLQMLPTQVINETLKVLQLAATDNSVHIRMRCASVKCLVYLKGGFAGIDLAVWCMETALPKAVIHAAWEEIASWTSNFKVKQSEKHILSKSIYYASKLLCNCELDRHTWHIIFIVLRNLAGLPPTLFLPPDSEAALFEEKRSKFFDEANIMPPIALGPGPAPSAGIHGSTKIKLSSLGTSKTSGIETKAVAIGNDGGPESPVFADAAPVSAKPVKLKLKLPIGTVDKKQ